MDFKHPPNQRFIKMRRFLLLLILSLPGMAALADSPREAMTCSAPAPQKSPASVVVDSIQWRDDLTRVYCRLIGKPRTSDRIDGVTMTVPSRRYDATDIDGVDFKRYFQWEDEPAIHLEIDFPPVGKPHYPCTLVFDTVHGEVKASAKE